MQYTKPMIDQVFQIRKALPEHMRSHIKLANPDLLDILADFYQQLQEATPKSLIKQLMTMAGPAWLSLLETRPGKPELKKSPSTEQAPIRDPQTQIAGRPATAANKSKTLIYRGHAVQS